MCFITINLGILEFIHSHHGFLLTSFNAKGFDQYFSKRFKMEPKNVTVFAPQLYIKSGIRDISFYEKAFGAVELRRFTNDDGSIHVAELSIDGALFHLHEDTSRWSLFNPEKLNATSVVIGLFVEDADTVMNKAIEAGAVVLSPAQNYDYGYRQGEIKDPFGHVWMIEMRI
jgi:PhnB protein